MRQSGARRKRCTECRGWFEAARSASETQKVCGEECRRRRRRRQGRARRRLGVQDYRVDERERQRECRRRRRAGGGEAGAACHAPASVANSSELVAKLLETWDRAAALSRAGLQRGIATLLRRSAAVSGTGEAAGSALSRATLGS